MTLAVVNSFPLKIDEDSLLKRKVMAVIQELSVFQMEAFTILFSYVRSNLYWSLIIDLEFAWCLFMTLSYGSKQQAIHIIFVFGVSVFLFVCFFYFFYVSQTQTYSLIAKSSVMLNARSVLDQKPLLQSFFGVDCFLPYH